MKESGKRWFRGGKNTDFRFRYAEDLHLGLALVLW